MDHMDTLSDSETTMLGSKKSDLLEISGKTSSKRHSAILCLYIGVAFLENDTICLDTVSASARAHSAHTLPLLSSTEAHANSKILTRAALQPAED